MEVLRRDVFPAEVACPDGRVIRRCRAFVTTSRLIVWTEQERRVSEALSVALAEPGVISGSRNTLGSGSIECETAEGPYWINTDWQAGCGCGSVLKALGPPVDWVGQVAA